MSISSYISGERLQELAEITVIFVEKAYPFLSAQLKNTKTSNFICNGSVIPEEVKNVKSVFVYTQMLDLFFAKIYPFIRNEFVLVSHNSDDTVTEKYKSILDNGKIIRWFSTNIGFTHEKLIALPIGIANSQWEHGNLFLLDKIVRENNNKNNLVYKNFNIGTSPSNRNYVDRATSLNKMSMSSKVAQEEYLRNIATSKFNICPLGNGIDCHRVWETLYLGTIPIVTDCINNRMFEDLPILFVKNNDWSIITKSYLEDKYSYFIDRIWNYEKLDLQYWKNRINEEK